MWLNHRGHKISTSLIPPKSPKRANGRSSSYIFRIPLVRGSPPSSSVAFVRSASSRTKSPTSAFRSRQGTKRLSMMCFFRRHLMSACTASHHVVPVCVCLPAHLPAHAWPCTATCAPTCSATMGTHVHASCMRACFAHAFVCDHAHVILCC